MPCTIAQVNWKCSYLCKLMMSQTYQGVTLCLISLYLVNKKCYGFLFAVKPVLPCHNVRFSYKIIVMHVLLTVQRVCVCPVVRNLSGLTELNEKL